MIYLLTVSLILLTILILVLIIRQRWNKFLILALVPFLLFNIGFTWHTTNELMGRAKKGLPSGEVELLHAAVKKPDIFLLLSFKDSKKEPALYKIPYSKEAEEKLNKVKQKIKSGRRIILNGELKNSDDGDETVTLKLYEWDHQRSMPKD